MSHLLDRLLFFPKGLEQFSGCWGLSARESRQLTVASTAFSRPLLEETIAAAFSCLDPQMRERARAAICAHWTDELKTQVGSGRFDGQAR